MDRDASRFWSEITDSKRYSITDLVLMTIYTVLTGEKHPLLTLDEEEKNQKELEEKKRAILAAEKARKKKLGLV